MEELWKLEISGPTGIRNLSTLFCWAAVLFYFLIIVSLFTVQLVIILQTAAN